MGRNDNFTILSKLILGGFFLFFCAIIIFLVRWQFLEKEEFVGLAAQRYVSKSVSSIRGDILARDDSTLAYSEPRYDVFAYIGDMKEAEVASKTRGVLQTREEFVLKVSNILGISQQELKDKLSVRSMWIKIASKIDYDTKLKLEALKTDYDPKMKLIGLNYEFTQQRLYPEGQLAAHVIGFVGLDLNSNDIGRGGVEQLYDGVLEPQEGFTQGETDKFGNLIVISDSVSIRAKRGSTVVTTIDPTIQKIIEKKIKDGVEQFEAESGSIVVMDPKNGEILGIANYPTYEPGRYFDIKDVNVLTNKAVTIPYEIGSVAKVFTMSAAVEELGIKNDEIVMEGHEGCIWIQASEIDENDQRQICTADKLPQGPMTATEALTKSDNIAFATLGKGLGKEKLYQYLSSFGVGKATQIDLSGESIGYLPSLSDKFAWHPVDVAVFSFGHGYEMNLVQATRGVAAVAHDGWMVQPYVVSEIRDADGSVKKFEPVPLYKVVSDDTAERVTLMMKSLYRENAKWGFTHLVNYPVAVKSGTALIPYKDKVGYSSEVNATYVGFDTTDEARFVMAIRLEAPKTVEKLSFYSARPLWFSTFDELKDYFGMKPEVIEQEN